MRRLALATVAAAAVLIAVPVTGQAAPATLQLTQPDNATEFSSKRRHFRHYGWYRGHHYGWRKSHFHFRSYGYRPYYRHYGRYYDDY